MAPIEAAERANHRRTIRGDHVVFGAPVDGGLPPCDGETRGSVYHKKIQRELDRASRWKLSPTNHEEMKLGLSRHFIGGAAWLGFGSLASKLLNGYAIILAAKSLGIETFGDYSLIRQTIGLFAIIASLGLNATVTRIVAVTIQSGRAAVRDLVTAAFVCSALLVSVTALVLYFAAPTLADDLLRPDLVKDIRSAGFLILTGCPLGVARGALQGLGRFSATSMTSLLEGAVSLALIHELSGRYGLVGVFTALGAGQLCGLLLAVGVLRGFVRPIGCLAAFWRVKRELLSFAIPVFFLSTIHGPTMWLFYRHISRVAEDSSQTLGILGAGDQIAILIAILPEAMSRVAMPMLARLRSVDIESGTARGRSIQLQAAVAILVGAAFYFGREFIPLILGREYAAVVPVAGVFCLYGMVRSTVHAGMMGLMAEGRPWTMFLTGLLFPAVLLASNAQLYKSLGVMGSSSALLGASLAQGLGVFLVTRMISRESQSRPSVDHCHGE